MPLNTIHNLGGGVLNMFFYILALKICIFFSPGVESKIRVRHPAFIRRYDDIFIVTMLCLGIHMNPQSTAAHYAML